MSYPNLVTPGFDQLLFATYVFPLAIECHMLGRLWIKYHGICLMFFNFCVSRICYFNLCITSMYIFLGVAGCGWIFCHTSPRVVLEKKNTYKKNLLSPQVHNQYKISNSKFFLQKKTFLFFLLLYWLCKCRLPWKKELLFSHFIRGGPY